LNHVHVSTDFGALEVVTGCMFSDKSETLIRRLRRARYEKKRVVGVKPTIDTRYSEADIASHGGEKFPATPVAAARDILAVPGVADADVVGIDEAQFFDDSLLDVCRDLLMQGKHVIVAGLDQDYRGNPFGVMPTLLALADYVTKLHAACTVCGGVATKSQRIVANRALRLVGGADDYEARCRKHWSPEPVFVQAGREDVDG
jgi:thymidine kinase